MEIEFNKILDVRNGSHLVENFIKELGEFMEENIGNKKITEIADETIKEIFSKRKPTTGNENAINFAVDDMLEKYENQELDKEEIDDFIQKIKNIANEILDKQDQNLSNYRKEGHLYLVSEEIGENRFLYDLTEKNENEFEEVNLSNELLEKATPGTVLIYENGEYKYFSNDGFERMEKDI